MAGLTDRERSLVKSIVDTATRILEADDANNEVWTLRAMQKLIARSSVLAEAYGDIEAPREWSRRTKIDRGW